MRNLKNVVLVLVLLTASNEISAQCNQFCTSTGTKKFFFSGASDYTTKTWSISGNTGMVIIGSNTGDTLEVNFAASSTGVDTVKLVLSNACSAAPMQKIPISILKTPDPIMFSKAPTTTCGGSDGNFVLSGLLANTTYDVYYTKLGVTSTVPATTDAIGKLTIPSLSAGIYTNINVKLTTTFSCSSAGLSDTIKDPAIPMITAKSKSQPTSCGGSEGSITLSGLTPATVYSVSYKKLGVFIVSNITASVTGQVVISNLNAGIYDSITLTLTACKSSIALPNPDTLVNPNPPVITSSYKINPTTCGGNQGSITLKGLINGRVYTIDYKRNGVSTSISLTAVGDSVIIPNLTQGTYDAITATYVACTSTPAVGPINLVDPFAPVITSNNFTNPTTCGGNEGTITLGGLTNGTTYMVKYFKDGVLDSVPLVAALNIVTVTGLKKGVYSGITVTSASCTSLPAANDTLRDPNPPVITGISDSMTLTCPGADGKLVLTGLLNSTNYIVNYDKVVPQGPVNLSSNASGNLTIGGLTTGTYSNITVTLNNCISNIVGPRTITGPPPSVGSLIFQCK